MACSGVWILYSYGLAARTYDALVFVLIVYAFGKRQNRLLR